MKASRRPSHTASDVGNAQSLRRCALGRVPIALLWVGLASCAVHVRGAVEQTPDGPLLTEPEGRARQLVLSGDSAPLAFLAGEGVEIDGVASFGRLRVTDWRVTEGTHGLQVFVGPIERRGLDVAILDRNSGVPVLVDKSAADKLAIHHGQPVLAEGFVEGAQRVRVVYYRVLSSKEHPQ